MADNVRTGMIPDLRMPTRAAPRPPNHAASRNVTWNNINDPFGDSFTQIMTQKKKPPPRPPPPKFKNEYLQGRKDQKPKKPARPAELLTFMSKINRKSTRLQQSSSSLSNNRVITNGQVPSNTTEDGNICLIDLSPPGSPTFTTRSSSDGVSVDSFGSDGNSNPSAFTSGSTSQTESAFEDDFDFFGSISSQKSVHQNDPWKVVGNQDPFSPRPATNNVKHVGDACFFAFNSDNAAINKQQQVPSNTSRSMPTIIRAKPSKQAVTKTAQDIFSTLTESAPKAIPKVVAPVTSYTKLDVDPVWDDDDPVTDEPSPPMPSIPPPPPPPEYLAHLEDGLTGSPVYPHGIVLYDLPASQPGDLALREGDVVMLVKAINNEWMEGRIGDRQGMFPVNFVDIKVPLPGTSKNIVNALYTFTGEVPGDLSFEEGARITVLSRISADWLYGECGGKRGQFPVNYVDRVPGNLPDSA